MKGAILPVQGYQSRPEDRHPIASISEKSGECGHAVHSLGGSISVREHGWQCKSCNLSACSMREHDRLSKTPSHLPPSPSNHPLPNNLGPHHVIPFEPLPAITPVMHRPDESMRFRRGRKGDDVLGRVVFCRSARPNERVRQSERRRKREKRRKRVNGERE